MTRKISRDQMGFSHILILLGVIVVVAIGFVGYRSYSAHADRQKFIEARAAIDSVYADVVHRVGKPDNYKRTNDCSRPSQEFTQGPLSCSVGTDFIYGVDNEDQANAKLKSIQAVIAAHANLFKPTKPSASALKDTTIVNTQYHKALDYYTTAANLSCVASYTYDTSSEIDLSINNLSKKPIEAGIACSGFAKSEYYNTIN